jgi:hypothetical protein
MVKKASDKTPSGPQLDILTAQKVFGWKNVHQHGGEIVGKKQDKAGRWRSARVPSFSTNPVLAYAIDDRMKQLGRSDRYQKELAKITRTKKLPPEWATPDQRARAALKAVRN